MKHSIETHTRNYLYSKESNIFKACKRELERSAK